LKTPPYLVIKNDLLARIQSGDLKEGDRVPSETQLVAQYNVSRMTAGRALIELMNEHVLIRTQGSGTFVAPPKFNSTLVEIRSIGDEIRERGHVHSSKVITLRHLTGEGWLTDEMSLNPKSTVLFSRILHFENEIPIQVEMRWVNPGLAPGYLEQDFTRITPSQYLMQVAPLQKVDYRIEASLPGVGVAHDLQIGNYEPCLLLHRRTWSQGRVASVVELWHPGARYQFSGQF